MLQMSDAHFQKFRVFLGGVNRSGMSDQSQHEAGDPHLHTETNSGGDGAVDNGDAARRARHQERLRQAAMNWDGVTFDHHLLPSNQRAAAEREKGEEETCRGESD